MRRLLFLALVFAFSSARAWRNEIYDANIASLTVMAGDDWQSPPVTTLSGKAINIDFDELSHDYHRYTYKVEHCEADWSPSEGLFPSDYSEGFYSDNTIEDYALSEDTYQIYTHWHLAVPNRNCRLTMSGNYRLTVYEDDDEEAPVLSACFMIAEEAVKVSMGWTANTDVDLNDRHQQLTMQADYTGLKVTSPEEQLHIVVMQNQRRDNAVVNPKIQFKAGSTLRWEHCRDLIFAAGNEYRKFETVSASHTSLGLDAVGWDAEASRWNAWVRTDEERRNWVYDVDADGSFLIRNSDYNDSDIRCDYILTHFELKAPPQNGKVYLDGRWTNGLLTPEYEMTWNPEKETYEGQVWLKQGYYSYRYVVLGDDGRLRNPSVEGDFYQTENSYQALVYYRGAGDRTWRLVGYASMNTGI